MNVATDSAASGPAATGNASGQDLDAVIAAALSAGGQDPDSAPDTPPEDIADELTNPEVAKLRGKSAGDDRDGEDASRDAGDKDAAVPGDKKPADKATSLDAPNHWPAARKQAFAKLPPEGKRELLGLARELEGGFTRKSQELSAKTRFADSVSRLFTDDDRAQLQAAGVDEVGAVDYLMNLQRFSAQKPVEYVLWAMHTLGVSPEDLPRNAAQPGQKPQAPDQAAAQPGEPKLEELLSDPAVKQLRTELAEAKETIKQIAGKLSQRDQAELQYAERQKYAQRQSLLSVVDRFRNEQDETGQLKYPHFDALMSQIGAIMQTDPKLRSLPDGPEKIAKAYQKVLRGDEELSKPIFEQELAKRLQAERKKADADRAKSATRVQPARGAPAQQAKNNSIDDAIAASFLKHGY